ALVVLDEDQVGHVVDEAAQQVPLGGERLLGLAAAGDVRVDAQDADDLAAGAAEGDLAGQEVDLAAVGPALGLLDVEQRPAAAHHGPVAARVEAGPRRRVRQAAAGLADPLRRRRPAVAAGADVVAAQVNAGAVLPEHAAGDGRDDVLQHRLLLAQGL